MIPLNKLKKFKNGLKETDKSRSFITPALRNQLFDPAFSENEIKYLEEVLFKAMHEKAMLENRSRPILIRQAHKAYAAQNPEAIKDIDAMGLVIETEDAMEVNNLDFLEEIRKHGNLDYVFLNMIKERDKKAGLDRTKADQSYTPIFSKTELDCLYNIVFPAMQTKLLNEKKSLHFLIMKRRKAYLAKNSKTSTDAVGADAADITSKVIGLIAEIIQALDKYKEDYHEIMNKYGREQGPIHILMRISRERIERQQSAQINTQQNKKLHSDIQEKG